MSDSVVRDMACVVCHEVPSKEDARECTNRLQKHFICIQCLNQSYTSFCMICTSSIVDREPSTTFRMCAKFAKMDCKYCKTSQNIGDMEDHLKVCNMYQGALEKRQLRNGTIEEYEGAKGEEKLVRISYARDHSDYGCVQHIRDGHMYMKEHIDPHAKEGEIHYFMGPHLVRIEWNNENHYNHEVVKHYNKNGKLDRVEYPPEYHKQEWDPISFSDCIVYYDEWENVSHITFHQDYTLYYSDFENQPRRFYKKVEHYCDDAGVTRTLYNSPDPDGARVVAAVHTELFRIESKRNTTEYYSDFAGERKEHDHSHTVFAVTYHQTKLTEVLDGSKVIRRDFASGNIEVYDDEDRRICVRKGDISTWYLGNDKYAVRETGEHAGRIIVSKEDTHYATLHDHRHSSRGEVWWVQNQQVVQISYAQGTKNYMDKKVKKLNRKRPPTWVENMLGPDDQYPVFAIPSIIKPVPGKPVMHDIDYLEKTAKLSKAKVVVDSGNSGIDTGALERIRKLPANAPPHIVLGVNAGASAEGIETQFRSVLQKIGSDPEVFHRLDQARRQLLM